jgi:hypothetical protein
MRELYFEEPVQAMIQDPDEPNVWLKGIVFRDFFLCGCSGEVYDLDEIARVFNDPKFGYIFLYKNWNALDEEIRGDLFPRGYIG